MHAISEAVQALSRAFEDHKDVFPRAPKRNIGSPSFSTLFAHSIWTAFFDRCLINLPTGEHVSPQYGGAWTLESPSLAHYPTVTIVLNRNVRDGSSYASALTPIPEEWLVERDWHIVHHLGGPVLPRRMQRFV